MSTQEEDSTHEPGEKKQQQANTTMNTSTDRTIESEEEEESISKESSTTTSVGKKKKKNQSPARTPGSGGPLKLSSQSAGSTPFSASKKINSSPSELLDETPSKRIKFSHEVISVRSHTKDIVEPLGRVSSSPSSTQSPPASIHTTPQREDNRDNLESRNLNSGQMRVSPSFQITLLGFVVPILLIIWGSSDNAVLQKNDIIPNFGDPKLLSDQFKKAMSLSHPDKALTVLVLGLSTENMTQYLINSFNDSAIIIKGDCDPNVFKENIINNTRGKFIILADNITETNLSILEGVFDDTISQLKYNGQQYDTKQGSYFLIHTLPPLPFDYNNIGKIRAHFSALWTGRFYQRIRHLVKYDHPLII